MGTVDFDALNDAIDDLETEIVARYAVLGRQVFTGLQTTLAVTKVSGEPRVVLVYDEGESPLAHASLDERIAASIDLGPFVTALRLRLAALPGRVSDATVAIRAIVDDMQRGG